MAVSGLRRTRLATRLLHFPSVAAAAVVASILLGLALTAGIAFRTSVGDAAIQRRLQRIDPAVAGLTVTTAAFADRANYDAATTVLTRETRSLPVDESPRVTAFGTPRVVSTDRGQTQVRLFLGTDALDHVDRLEGSGDNGLWISDRVAEPLGVGAGDTITITSSGRDLKTTIAGIYRDLVRDEHRDHYWQPLSFDIVPPPPAEIPLPAFAIADTDTFMELAHRMAYPFNLKWEFPFNGNDLSLAQAQRAAVNVRSVEATANSPESELGRALGKVRGGDAFPDLTSALPNLVRDATDVDARLAPSIGFVTFAAAIVALVAVAAAGIFNPSKRRIESQLLVTHGVGPTRQAVRASVESVIPILIGIAIGTVVANLLISRWGPSSEWSPDWVGSVLGAIPAAVLAIAVFATATGGEIARRSDALAALRFSNSVRWDLIALVIAGASGYEILTRGGEVDTTTDLLALAFPLFLTLAVVTLLIRLWRRLAPSVERHLPRRKAAFIGVARLANLRGPELAVFVLVGLASGMILYAATAIRSESATAEAKSHVATGSDVNAALSKGHEVPDLAEPLTSVLRSPADWLPEETPVDVGGIDPSTFARAAYWDPSFAPIPLDELLQQLSSSEKPLPAVIAGVSAPSDATLSFPDVEIPVDVVATATALPGMVDRPVVLVDRDALATYSQGPRYGDPLQGATELWIKGQPATITRELDGVPGIVGISIASDSAVADLVQEQLWILGLLRALGIGLAILAAAAVLFYNAMDRRGRAVWYVLAKRMSLSTGTHIASLAIELGALVVAGAIVGGAVGVGSARLLSTTLDPLPSDPPAPLFRIPGPAVAAVLVGAVVLLVLSSLRGHRLAESTDPALAMRAGE